MNEEQERLIQRIKERVKKRCDEYGLEADTLLNYIEHGWEPGGFLMAVLEDRLTESFCRADGWNQQRMLGWATVMYNDVPRDARGSKEHVGRWIAHRGLRGLMTEKTDG